MEFPEELQLKIKKFFENNEELRDKLLSGDAESIRQIGLLSQRGINPKEILEACESNDSDLMKNLYNKAKRTVELQKLYKELCEAYSKEMRNKSGIDR